MFCYVFGSEYIIFLDNGSWLCFIWFILFWFGVYLFVSLVCIFIFFIIVFGLDFWIMYFVFICVLMVCVYFELLNNLLILWENFEFFIELDDFIELELYFLLLLWGFNLIFILYNFFLLWLYMNEYFLFCFFSCLVLEYEFDKILGL